MERKSLIKTVLAAVLVIGSSTLLFQGLALAATKLEFNNTNTIPTSYASSVTVSTKSKENSVPDGYKKADYKVGKIDLEYYRGQTPTDKDMTGEEAAENSAQALWEIYGLDLEGQKILMGYSQATENLPRSNWNADVYIDGVLKFSLCVDSVTGELFSIGQLRTLKEKVSVSFDKELDKNPQEYVELAKSTAEKFNVVHSAVKSVEYNGQGYANNDPSISIDVKGENGEVALMDFSRYDKALLGIIYNTEYKAALERAQNYEKEMLDKMNEKEKSAPATDDSGELIQLQ